ncbi:choline binding protein a [Plakobranchus ocellatus]|uniref:Choline binding protein a n=1 Tax=Plakobranchus ocellatus TaxID=259542 RepID=A0AAV4C969_9GAST|nr:choline binding protein a [Plakobranchus ocellatus]
MDTNPNLDALLERLRKSGKVASETYARALNRSDQKRFNNKEVLERHCGLSSQDHENLSLNKSIEEYLESESEQQEVKDSETERKEPTRTILKCFFASCSKQQLSPADRRHLRSFHKGVLPKKEKKKRKRKSDPDTIEDSVFSHANRGDERDDSKEIMKKDRTNEQHPFPNSLDHDAFDIDSSAYPSNKNREDYFLSSSSGGFLSKTKEESHNLQNPHVQDTGAFLVHIDHDSFSLKTDRVSKPHQYQAPQVHLKNDSPLAYYEIVGDTYIDPDFQSKKDSFHVEQQLSQTVIGNGSSHVNQNKYQLFEDNMTDQVTQHAESSQILQSSKSDHTHKSIKGNQTVEYAVNNQVAHSVTNISPVNKSDHTTLSSKSNQIAQSGLDNHSTHLIKSIESILSSSSKSSAISGPGKIISIKQVDSSSHTIQSGESSRITEPVQSEENAPHIENNTPTAGFHKGTENTFRKQRHHTHLNKSNVTDKPNESNVASSVDHAGSKTDQHFHPIGPHESDTSSQDASSQKFHIRNVKNSYISQKEEARYLSQTKDGKSKSDPELTENDTETGEDFSLCRSLPTGKTSQGHEGKETPFCKDDLSILRTRLSRHSCKPWLNLHTLQYGLHCDFPIPICYCKFSPSCGLQCPCSHESPESTEVPDLIVPEDSPETQPTEVVEILSPPDSPKPPDPPHSPESPHSPHPCDSRGSSHSPHLCDSCGSPHSPHPCHSRGSPHSPHSCHSCDRPCSPNSPHSPHSYHSFDRLYSPGSNHSLHPSHSFDPPYSPDFPDPLKPVDSFIQPKSSQNLDISRSFARQSWVWKTMKGNDFVSK